jgi:hypothetical protein
MVAKNDITGDPIASKAATDAFRAGWDRIFNAKEDTVLIEKDYDGGVIISVSGNRNLMKLSQKQFDRLIIAVLKQVTAEHIAEALKEVE